MDQLCENNMADTTTAQQPSRAPSQGRSALPGLGYKAQHGKESTRPGEPGSADCNGQNLSKKKRNRGKRRRKPKLEDTPFGVTTATAGMQTMGLEQVTVTSIPAAMAGDGDVEGVSEGIEDLELSDSTKRIHGRKPMPLEPCITASAQELAKELDLYATSNRTEPVNILHPGGSQGITPCDLTLGPGNSGKSEVALPADSTTEATIPIARAGDGTVLEVPAPDHVITKRRFRKEADKRKQKAAADEERMTSVRSTLHEIVPADVLMKLLPVWRKKFEMLDLAESLLKECEAVEELHHTLEVISLVWDRWGGWIKDLPQSALMSAAQRRARDAQRRDVGAERMEEVRTSLGLIVPPAAVSELLLCWKWDSRRDRGKVCEQAFDSLADLVPWIEVNAKVEAIGDLWDRLKADEDYISGEESDCSVDDFDGLEGLQDYLDDGDFKGSFMDGDSSLFDLEECI